MAAAEAASPWVALAAWRAGAVALSQLLLLWAIPAVLQVPHVVAAASGHHCSLSAEVVSPCSTEKLATVVPHWERSCRPTRSSFPCSSLVSVPDLQRHTA